MFSFVGRQYTMQDKISKPARRRNKIFHNSIYKTGWIFFEKSSFVFKHFPLPAVDMF